MLNHVIEQLGEQTRLGVAHVLQKGRQSALGGLKAHEQPEDLIRSQPCDLAAPEPPFFVGKPLNSQPNLGRLDLCLDPLFILLELLKALVEVLGYLDASSQQLKFFGHRFVCSRGAPARDSWFRPCFL